MKITIHPVVIAPIRAEKAVGLAAALGLHALILFSLWHYQIVPPPTKALTVFVNFINPAAPLTTISPQPPVPRPTPPRPASARPALPVTQPTAVATPAPVMASPKPAVSPADPVVPQPAVKTAPKPAPVAAPAASGPASAQEPVAPHQPVVLAGELSVSCPERTPPSYPKQSLRLGEQGKTVLLVELDELGTVAQVSVKSGSGFPRLDEAAMSAVRNWRCTPAKRNGVAVRSLALQPFNFTIKGR